MAEVPESRRRIMRAIRSRDTALNGCTEFGTQDWLPFPGLPQDLPGCPDIVFPRLRKFVFVHGCFGNAMIGQGSGSLLRIARYWKEKIARTLHAMKPAGNCIKKTGLDVDGFGVRTHESCRH